MVHNTMLEKTLIFLIVAVVSCLEIEAQGCKKLDAAIIVELPKDKISSNDRTQLKNFLTSIARSIRIGSFSTSCSKLSISFVDDGKFIPVVKFTDSQNPWKISSAIGKFRQPMAAVGGKSTKNIILEHVADLKNKVFNGARKEKNIRKVLLVILTRTPDVELRLYDKFKTVLENRYEVLAIGIGEGRKENLLRMTFDKSRIHMISKLDKLNKGPKIITSNFEINKAAVRVPIGPTGMIGDPVGVLTASDGVPGLQGAALEEIVECEYAVDIAFLIDSSYSVKLDYDKELQFVQEIARRFGISETGTHAGVVVFSDYKNHTRVTIKMNEYFSTEAFNNGIANSPFIGYRTRIDYAFEKVEKELFTIKGGARPNMKKLIFLITDGRQNPRNATYDPVKTSQSLYDKGVPIFAVGVSSDVNKTELEALTRHKERVYYENTFDDILQTAFIKKVSKQICKEGYLPTTPPPIITTPQSPPNTEPCKTTPQAKCSNACHSCCSPKDVYINIFQSGSGPNYVMQGITLTGDSSNVISGQLLPTSATVPKGNATSKMTNDELLQLIKNALPYEPTLTGLIEKKLNAQKGARNEIHKRKRRSIIDDSTEQDMLSLKQVLNENSDLSIFKRILLESEFNKIKHTRTIHKLCFTENLCVSLTNDLQIYLQKILESEKFTYLIPTNKYFNNMNTEMTEKILNSKASMVEFVMKFVYLGEIQFNPTSPQMSHNLSKQPGVGLFHEDGSVKIVSDINHNKFKVGQLFKVKEGVVYVIE